MSPDADARISMDKGNKPERSQRSKGKEMRVEN
jgi:hypothetical protein